MSAEVEVIEDGVELQQVQRQAKGVLIKSAIASTVLTLIALLLPATG